MDESCGYFEGKHSRNSKSTGTKAGECVMFSRKQEEDRVTGAEGAGERSLRDRIREDQGSPIFKTF